MSEEVVLMPFRLLGFDNPFDRYPAPVIPIGMLDGKLVAWYHNGHEQVDQVGVAIGFTRLGELPEEIVQKLKSFDPEKERLFADGPDKVESYPIVGEAEYFRRRLSEEGFCSDQELKRMFRRIAELEAEYRV